MSRRDAGFTLLEMLVALVVFGLVMAGIAQTFRFGLIAWPAAERSAAGGQDLAALDAGLTSMIAGAQPGSMTASRGELAFTTRLPAAGIDGLVDVAIGTAPGGEFLLRYGPHPAGIPLAPRLAPRLEPLAQGVAGFSVSYFAPQTNGPPAWSDSWSGDGLPLLVRIHLAFADGRHWPDLVAAPIDGSN
jgi:general secretion pathway protein J